MVGRPSGSSETPGKSSRLAARRALLAGQALERHVWLPPLPTRAAMLPGGPAAWKAEHSMQSARPSGHHAFPAHSATAPCRPAFCPQGRFQPLAPPARLWPGGDVAAGTGRPFPGALGWAAACRAGREPQHIESMQWWSWPGMQRLCRAPSEPCRSACWLWAVHLSPCCANILVALLAARRHASRSSPSRCPRTHTPWTLCSREGAPLPNVAQR